MRALFLIFAAAVGLAACSFDFESFAIDDGGAPGNGNGTGAETGSTYDAQPDGDETATDGQTKTDAAIEDESTVDAPVGDTSIADTSIADTSVADTSIADTSVPDVSTVQDTGVDSASCTPSAACIANAVTCASDCRTTSDQCVAACGPKKCKDTCRAVEAQCKIGCKIGCTTCTEGDGCPAPAQCGSASK